MKKIYSKILDSLESIGVGMASVFSENLDDSYISDELGVRPSLSSPEVISGSFSIIPRVYELELNKKYGIKLDELKNGKKSRFKGDLTKNVSFNGCHYHSLRKIEDRILKKHESVPDFCSMLIETKEELLEHVKYIHELSYNHYVWAKETNMKGQFPHLCCGHSSKNLFLTLMKNGYSNSSALSMGKFIDHTYVALPFVLDKDNEKGFIIVDPTSDQLFNHNAPRNYLFVIFGTEWLYETDWADGSNLYPDSSAADFANLHTLRHHPDPYIYRKKDTDEYFREVFKNPVNVTIEAIGFR